MSFAPVHLLVSLSNTITGMPLVTNFTSSRIFSFFILTHPWLRLPPTDHGASVPWMPVELNPGVTMRKKRNDEVETRVTDETLRRIRSKLSLADSSVLIETVWGYGYRLYTEEYGE